MKRYISASWISALTLALVSPIVLSRVAAAQYYDYDGGYYAAGSAEQARQYGYQSGYRDGYHKGVHEGRENDPGDINFRALQNATHGYREWMGPIYFFRDGYRDGYQQGFRAGFHTGNHPWRYRDDDDWYRR